MLNGLLWHNAFAQCQIRQLVSILWAAVDSACGREINAILRVLPTFRIGVAGQRGLSRSVPGNV
jgi:hypothetical protein